MVEICAYVLFAYVELTRSATLGKGGCPLCKYHLHYIKSERNFHQQILGSSFEWTKILQFDQFLHQLELTEEDSFQHYYKESSKNLPREYNALDFQSLQLRGLASLLHPLPPPGI